MDKIHSIALVAPDNVPLYVRNFVSQDAEADLKSQFLVHGSLDVVADRNHAARWIFSRTDPTEAASKQMEQYLGLLFTEEDVAVYGFQTCTRLKIIVMVLATSGQVVRDLDMITIFRAIYHSYLRYTSNPFADLPSQLALAPGTESTRSITDRPIRSKTFDRQMELVAGL